MIRVWQQSGLAKISVQGLLFKIQTPFHVTPVALFSPASLHCRLKSVLGLVLFSLSSPVSQAEPPTAYHVASHGADSSDGSAAHPFASLERPKQAVRSLKSSQAALPSAGIVVWIEPGHYHRTAPLSFSSPDSGTENSPIVWKARTPGTVHLNLSVALKSAHLHPVEQSEQARIAPEAQGQIWVADLATLAIQNPGPYPVNFDNGSGLAALFFNGQHQPLSRWPNREAARMERVLGKESLDSEKPRRGGKFVAREDRVWRWPVDRGVWLEEYWRVPWDPRTGKVAAIDPATREITLADAVSGGIRSKYGGPEDSGTEP